MCVKDVSLLGLWNHVWRPSWFGNWFYSELTLYEPVRVAVLIYIIFELLYSDIPRCPHVNVNHTRFCFVTGEERFETIRDLVANGLNALYTKSNTDMYDLYPKAMMISPVKDEGKTVNDEIKENNEIASEYMETKAPYELHPHDLKVNLNEICSSFKTIL